MAREIIDVGVSGDPTTGDSVRDSLGKANANDAELYARDDPRVMARIFDDFASGFNNSGNVGDLGWQFTGGGVSAAASPPGRVGTIVRNIGAVANTYATMTPYFNVSSGQVHANDAWTWTWSFLLAANGADVDNLVRVGLALSTPDPPNNGVYFEKPYDDNNWYAVCRSAGVESRSAIVAPTTAAWVRLSARRTTAGVAFSVNGGAEVSVNTNVPTVALSPFFAMKNRTAVDKFATIDYFDLVVTGLAR